MPLDHGVEEAETELDLADAALNAPMIMPPSIAFRHGDLDGGNLSTLAASTNLGG